MAHTRSARFLAAGLLLALLAPAALPSQATDTAAPAKLTVTSTSADAKAEYDAGVAAAAKATTGEALVALAWRDFYAGGPAAKPLLRAARRCSRATAAWPPISRRRPWWARDPMR